MGLLRTPRFGPELKLPNYNFRRQNLRQNLQKYVFRRQTLTIGVIILIFLIVGPAIFVRHHKPFDLKRPSEVKKPKFEAPPSLQQLRLRPQPLLEGQSSNFHLLIVVPNSEDTLCKTLLSAAVLGYPVPTLLQWNETHDLTLPMGGNKYSGKIKSVSEWLNSRPKSDNDDIVLMVDAYGAFNYHDVPIGLKQHTEADIWFQLGPEVLLKRYYAMSNRATEDLTVRLGKAVEKEKLKQSVFFGAGKRCAPNLPYSVACYATPESPLPDDLYSHDTDTVIGHNRFSSHRQRYVNSGYAIGPVSDMRTLFKRAYEKVKSVQNEEGNYKYFADFSHAGSDQGIFQEIFGEQELQREVMRRRHLSFSDKAKGLGKRPTKIEGTVIEDILAPTFSHFNIEQKKEKVDEFSMAIDYWSDLGQQMVDSSQDSRWLTYNRPVTEQLAQRKAFDCPPRATGSVPDDMLNTTLPRAAVSDASQFSPSRGWDEIPLYTNLCMDTIPVMIHHNGEKKQRDDAWPSLWIQPHARRLMEEVLARGEGQREGARGGGFTPNNRYHPWHKLCPGKLEAELYRDTSDYS